MSKDKNAFQNKQKVLMITCMSLAMEKDFITHSICMSTNNNLFKKRSNNNN